MPHNDDRPFRYTEEALASALAEALAPALAAALREVLTDKKVVARQTDVLMAVLQERAAQKAGGLILGGLKTLLLRGALLASVVFGVAALFGGKAAVALVWSALTGRAP